MLLLATGLLAAGESLRPANWGTWGNLTDSMGNRWDMSQQGAVSDGSNDCFDTGMLLQVNSNQFNPSQRRETADGRELVLDGTQGQLRITRRIQMDSQRGALRYLEIIANTGNAQANVTVGITGNLGSSAQSMQWNTGAAAQGAMPKGACGIIAQQNRGGSRPSVVWVLGESGAAVAPTVNFQHSQQFTFTWSLQIPAGQTRAVLHYVAQRQNLAQVQGAVDPFHRRGRLVDRKAPTGVIPSQIVNFRIGGEEGEIAAGLPFIDRLMERLEATDRKADLIALGGAEGVRMTGQLVGGPFAATGAFGTVQCRLDEIAGMQGDAGGVVLYLRTGEAIAAGSVSAQLQLAADGDVMMAVDPSRLDALIGRHASGDGRPPADYRALVDLADGSRLALTSLAGEVELATPWGLVRIALDRIDSVHRVVDPRPAWIVRLADGSRITAAPASADILVSMARFGQRRLPLGAITGWRRIGTRELSSEPEEPDEAKPGLVTTSGDRLMAPLRGAVVLVAGGATTAIRVERIAAITRSEAGGLSLRLRDGAVLSGRADPPELRLGTGDAELRVPMPQVAAFQAPAPVAPAISATAATAPAPTSATVP